MNPEILKNALEEYFYSFKAALSFALLLVFVFPFLYISNIFISSGSLFLDYNFLRASPADLFLLLFSVLLFVFFYSIFITLIIFSTRTHFSSVKLHYYLSEKVNKFALKIFIFYTILIFTMAILTSLLTNIGVPSFVLNLLWFVFSVAFLFFPQVVVIEECSFKTGLEHNKDFLKENIQALLLVIVTGTVLLVLVGLLEYLIDLFVVAGRFVSLLLLLVFVVPFIEVLKTVLYLHKFDLVKASYKNHRKL